MVEARSARRNSASSTSGDVTNTIFTPGFNGGGTLLASGPVDSTLPRRMALLARSAGVTREFFSNFRLLGTTHAEEETFVKIRNPSVPYSREDPATTYPFSTLPK